MICIRVVHRLTLKSGFQEISLNIINLKLPIFAGYIKIIRMHSLVLGFLNIGSSEMILIVFVALLLFGGEKLPEIARGLGKGIRDFKDASDGVKREINNQINSYEEKREEQKRIEEVTRVEDKATENSENESPASRFTPVENTMSVNDGYLNSTHNTAETHDSGHEATAGNHEATAHDALHSANGEVHTSTATESVHGVNHEQVSTGNTENS